MLSLKTRKNLVLFLLGFVGYYWLFHCWVPVLDTKDKVYISEYGISKLYFYDVKKGEYKRPFKKLTYSRKTEKTFTIETTESKRNYMKDPDVPNQYKLVQESKVKYAEPKKIAILYIATGKYIRFWDDFYKNTEKYFLPHHKKTYFLFTNHDDLKVANNVVKVHQDQLPWPYITLKRFHFFDGIKDKLKEYDYIYFLNGTLLPKAEVNEEIFPTKEQKIMVTLHPGYWFKSRFQFPYDNNKKSQAYIPDYEGDYYVMGGFNGGTRTGFLTLIETLKIWTDIDIKNKAIPAWHDESMLNRYLVTVMNKGEQPLILLPEYAIPQTGRRDDVDELRPYTKMLILDKGLYGGHGYLRSFEK